MKQAHWLLKIITAHQKQFTRHSNLFHQDNLLITLLGRSACSTTLLKRMISAGVNLIVEMKVRETQHTTSTSSDKRWRFSTKTYFMIRYLKEKMARMVTLAKIVQKCLTQRKRST